MNQPIRVFVNERALDVSTGSTVIAVIESYSKQLADRLRDGRGRVTDGVGRDMDLADTVQSGAILRTVGTGGKPDRADD